MDKYEKIKKIIKDAGSAVNFANFGNGVSNDWIRKAEERLGFDLPKSYKWWLRKYGGGEIYGEEIYSIYEQNFDEVIGGDIVYMHELNQEKNIYSEEKLIICETDTDIFYFNLAKREGDEMPIYSIRTDSKYADDFIDFLEKRINKNE